MIGVREDDGATPWSSRLVFLALVTTKRCRCFFCAQISRRVFSGSALGVGRFFAEVVSIFNLGESYMFPAFPDAAREREFVTRPVPSSAADVCHYC